MIVIQTRDTTSAKPLPMANSSQASKNTQQRTSKAFTRLFEAIPPPLDSSELYRTFPVRQDGFIATDFKERLVERDHTTRRHQEVPVVPDGGWNRYMDLPILYKSQAEGLEDDAEGFRVF